MLIDTFSAKIEKLGYFKAREKLVLENGN